MKKILALLAVALASAGIAFAQAPAKDAKKPDAMKEAPAKADAKKAAPMDINTAAPKELATLPDQGLTSYKLFMAYKGALMVDDETLYRTMEVAAKTGAPEKCVLDWVTAADRMRIKGVGSEYSELLRAAGVRTVNELRFRNPQKLASVMGEVNTRRKLVRVLPSVNTVARWIETAKKLPPLISY